MHSAAQIRAFAAWLRNKGSTLSILNSRSTGVRWSPWAAGGRGPAAEANGRSLATPTRTGARPFPGGPTGARSIAGGAVTTRPWGRAAGPGSTVGMAAMSATTPWTARRGRPGRPRVGGPAGCRAWRLAAGATVAAGTRAVTGSWRSSRGGAHRFWRWRRQGQGSAVGGALLGPAVAASSPRPEGREARAGPLGQRSRLRGAGRACTLVVRRWGPGPLPVEAEEPPGPRDGAAGWPGCVSSSSRATRNALIPVVSIASGAMALPACRPAWPPRWPGIPWVCGPTSTASAF